MFYILTFYHYNNRHNLFIAKTLFVKLFFLFSCKSLLLKFDIKLFEQWGFKPEKTKPSES